MKEKLLTLLLTTLIVFNLIGCGSMDAETESGSVQETQETEENMDAESEEIEQTDVTEESISEPTEETASDLQTEVSNLDFIVSPDGFHSDFYGINFNNNVLGDLLDTYSFTINLFTKDRNQIRIKTFEDEFFDKDSYVDSFLSMGCTLGEEVKVGDIVFTRLDRVYDDGAIQVQLLAFYNDTHIQIEIYNMPEEEFEAFVNSFYIVDTDGTNNLCITNKGWINNHLQLGFDLVKFEEKVELSDGMDFYEIAYYGNKGSLEISYNNLGIEHGYESTDAVVQKRMEYDPAIKNTKADIIPVSNMEWYGYINSESDFIEQISVVDGSVWSIKVSNNASKTQDINDLYTEIMQGIE